jgi:hypothetical protein
VEDLRAEDFRVFDAGREQKLVYFRRGQDVTAGAMPGKWCNYRYGTFPHVVVVLLDQLNSKLELRGSTGTRSGTPWRGRIGSPTPISTCY